MTGKRRKGDGEDEDEDEDEEDEEEEELRKRREEKKKKKKKKKKKRGRGQDKSHGGEPVRNGTVRYGNITRLTEDSQTWLVSCSQMFTGTPGLKVG